jgi:hypothetical protein
MSYSSLGTSCSSHTIAYTSNRKFLPLHSQIYKKQCTYMLEYPGTSVISDSTEHITHPSDGVIHPEIIKSYYGKIWNHEENNSNTQKIPNSSTNNKSCSSC